jgi:hypothetical protein
MKMTQQFRQKTKAVKIILHRGSGRRVKRFRPVNREALFYAVATGIFAEQVAFNFGGDRHEWMTKVSQRAAQMLLTFSQDQLEEWLFDNVLLRDK